ncbi:MAG: acyl-CoA thioesterase [Clostridiales Family XIII bacterium]|jgi:acyl-CoA thioester hydrolase|nr:acyl-CoA thioesterase [Clostridiales Family XIII bacterium]
MAKKFYSETRVIYADTDAMGVAYHGNFIKWFEIGRTEYLRQIGYPYAELEKKGIWLPVTEVACKYRRPALYDDRLDIVCRVDDLGGASIVMAYEILRKADGELLAAGKTWHGITDHNLRPVRLKRLMPDLYAAVVLTLDDGTGA